jgi:hypothetical protein
VDGGIHANNEPHNSSKAIAASYLRPFAANRAIFWAISKKWVMSPNFSPESSKISVQPSELFFKQAK